MEPKQKLRVCLFGIGSRVAIIAKAIAGDAHPLIDWCVNAHCPFGHRLVFPNGIPGVDFVESEQGNRIGYLLDIDPKPPAIAAALLRVFAAMEIPDPEALELGILFRGMRFDVVPDMDPFITDVQAACATTQGPVAVLADSRREEIHAAIGDRSLRQQSPAMAHDLDRTSEGVREYLAEWRQLLACAKVVTNCPGSTIIWPRQFLNLPSPCSITT